MKWVKHASDESATGGRLRWVSLGLTVALVAALVGLGVLWRSYQQQQDLQEAGDAAELAARSAVTQMTTYDYRTVDEDFTWVEDAGTEKFQEYFAGASDKARKFIKAVKASAEGRVVDSAAHAQDDEHVRVLLFVDQTISSQGQNGSKVDQPRVTMRMVLEDGTWLVDQVQVNNLLTR